MVTSNDCFAKYGAAEDQKFMKLYDLDVDIHAVPKRVYCNVDMIKPLRTALNFIKNRGLSNELKTWDGVFCIRKKRGARSYSLHSWGIAVDVNAFENGMGSESKLSEGFVKCFKDAGFDWGGDWKRRDPMHFQISKI